MNFDDVLQPALDQRKIAALYRQREVGEIAQQVVQQRRGRRFLAFCSNDYLGLANHPKVIEAFVAASKIYGVGSGASHLVCGHSREHHALEEELAEFTQRPRALLFSTGYMANLGVINALTGRGDVVFEDRLNHASLLDAALLSSAKMQRYQHNDVAQLDILLAASAARRKLIAVDAVFSMDGDFADLAGLARLADKHQAWLMIDDAHGFGCVGAGGRGTGEHFALSGSDVPILMGTLGKACGTFGAFVAGSQALIETLIQFSRTYIYTTALPPAIAAASRASLKLIQQEPERRQHLNQLIAYFRKACQQARIPLLQSSTAIQPVLLGDSGKGLAVSAALEQRGLLITAIRPPTVPQHSARLRITLCAEHQFEHLDQLVQALADVLNTRHSEVWCG